MTIWFADGEKNLMINQNLDFDIKLCLLI